MARAQPSELGARKAAVLRAVVEEYIRTGEPVGSETVVERYSLNVSPATIRNEMSALEELGYLHHPHTSAGRTPTDLGYRHYVDSLRSRVRLRETQRRAIAQFFERTAHDMEEVLIGATRLLSQLTQYAGLAVPPSSFEDRIARAELIQLGSVMLILVVGHHGRVYKAVLDRGDLAEDTISAAGDRLSGLHDLTLAQAAERLRSLASREASAHHRGLIAAVAGAFEELAHRSESEEIVVGGMGNLAAEVAMWRRDTLQRLFEAVEQESRVLRLLLEVSPAEEVAVTIGAEHPATQMLEAAVVAAPYGVEGASLGTIGVMGPTRMDYLSTMSAVRAVARRLSELATALERPIS
ncbi:MAG: heat-inducible transcriptional repressor HrcA [Actinomycetota bacterium]|nr:heat-inducible transcriptional repressor HrcA [Actinomycetota bacterium]